MLSVYLLIRVRAKMARTSSLLTEKFFTSTVETEARAHGNFPPDFRTRRGLWVWEPFKRAFGVNMRPLESDESVDATALWKQYLYRASGARTRWHRSIGVRVRRVSLFCHTTVWATARSVSR